MPKKLNEVLLKVLDWLKDVLPTAGAFGYWIYNRMKQRIIRLEKEKGKVELEKKYLENREKVERDNADKSDADIVRDAIDEGKRD